MKQEIFQIDRNSKNISSPKIIRVLRAKLSMGFAENSSKETELAEDPFEGDRCNSSQPGFALEKQRNHRCLSAFLPDQLTDSLCKDQIHSDDGRLYRRRQNEWRKQAIKQANA